MKIDPEKRARILDASLSIFSSKGYDNTTTDEIMKLAGVGKGTLYRYFKNKAELFNTLVSENLEELEERMKNACSGLDDIEKLVEKTITTYLTFFREKKGFFSVLEQQGAIFPEKFNMLMKERMTGQTGVLIKEINRCIKSKNTRPLDPEIVALVIVGVMKMFLVREIKGGKKLTSKEIETIKKILLFGIKA